MILESYQDIKAVKPKGFTAFDMLIVCGGDCYVPSGRLLSIL